MTHDNWIVERLAPEAYATETGFTDLASAAEYPNPHAQPHRVLASRLFVSPDRIVVLAARRRSDGLLAGVWPLARTRLAAIPTLESPLVGGYDVSSMPVVRRGFEHAVADAFVDAIRRSGDLPKLIVSRLAVTEGAFWQGLMALADRNTLTVHTAATWQRAVMLSSAGIADRRSTKRLRSKLRRLEELGSLAYRAHVGGPELEAAFAAFTALESAGWKGRRGTALAQRPIDATYVRALLAAGVADGTARIDLLSLGGRTIAGGLLLTAGDTLFFYKTAYAEAFARHSPGAVFDLMLSDRLIAEGSLKRLDSSSDDSVDPGGLIWAGRQPMGAIVIDLSPGSLAGQVVLAVERLRTRARRFQRGLASAS